MNRKQVVLIEWILLLLLAGLAVFGIFKAITPKGKGAKDGGKKIREMGVNLQSLAIIESMTQDSLTFREE